MERPGEMAIDAGLLCRQAWKLGSMVMSHESLYQSSVHGINGLQLRLPHTMICQKIKNVDTMLHSDDMDGRIMLITNRVWYARSLARLFALDAS